MPLRKKKVFAVFSAACLVLGLVGCKTDLDIGQIDTAQNVQETQQITETTVPESSDKEHFETKFKIMDWTANDFCTILCRDAIVSIPCKFSDIDDKFDKKIVASNEQNISKLDYVELYLDDEYVGALYFSEYDYDIENDLLSFASLETFDIKGLNEYSSKEDVQKELGAGNNIDFEYGDSYYVDNMMIIFNYLNNKTSLTVAIY